ncbi:uncharacterized protein LOC128400706 isoform X2 [Podarcis raffonei]|uniref:uncharacterized protein LOC128400706 isoform X2 n=1 Tax=Podarcis raffonei TaxID=65483 RepID=UPI0023297907|nr:uncharacterized protein LOC128400706 isoform X2 [Podarcis raffonei]
MTPGGPLPTPQFSDSCLRRWAPQRLDEALESLGAPPGLFPRQGMRRGLAGSLEPPETRSQRRRWWWLSKAAGHGICALTFRWGSKCQRPRPSCLAAGEDGRTAPDAELRPGLPPPRDHLRGGLFRLLHRGHGLPPRLPWPPPQPGRPRRAVSHARLPGLPDELRADLVPVYTFGENDIYRQIRFPEGSFARRFQLGFKQLIGFAPCLFSGRGLFSSRSWGIQPMAAPLTVVVGKPIPVPRRPRPTEDEVNSFHALYVKALKELFDAHKESCGLPASQQLLVT